MIERSPYIVGRTYDWVFFLLPPAMALLLGIAISGSDFSVRTFDLAGSEVTWTGVFMGSMIHAHLVAVFFRSHGNPEIFKLYPYRFVAVPVLLLLTIAWSAWAAVIATAAATFWDVWHSGAQTFGFGRIYDRNAGNEPTTGRRMDFWLNQVVYAGPIIGGATLIDHVDTFAAFESVEATFFTAIPARVGGVAHVLTWGMLAVGTTFLIAYVLYYARLHRKGYKLSPLKTFLYVSTAACSIYTWGFNSWGEAFFIMNFFHAVQYLAIVWAVEKPRMVDYLGFGSTKYRGPTTFAVFLGAVFSYGVFAEVVDADFETIWAVTIVVSLMHFWYDSFVWSVQRQQV